MHWLAEFLASLYFIYLFGRILAAYAKRPKRWRGELIGYHWTLDGKRPIYEGDSLAREVRSIR